MRKRSGLTLVAAAAFSVAVMLGGCADKETATPEKPKTEAVKTETAKPETAKPETAKAETPKVALPGVGELKAEGLKVLLAKADKFDGTEDKIVSKCSSCGLGMDGIAEHAVSAHGYTLHFCSDKCKTGFSKDLDKSILALKVPKSP